jgi:hypothetical protein
MEPWRLFGIKVFSNKNNKYIINFLISVLWIPQKQTTKKCKIYVWYVIKLAQQFPSWWKKNQNAPYLFNGTYLTIRWLALIWSLKNWVLLQSQCEYLFLRSPYPVCYVHTFCCLKVCTCFVLAHPQGKKERPPSLHDVPCHWLHGNSIPNIGCHSSRLDVLPGFSPISLHARLASCYWWWF